MAKRPVKCPICQKKYISKLAVYSHIERAHEDILPEGMCGGEYYYRLIYGRGGRCVICKKETTWNTKTNKFNRFCNNPECKKKYKETFQKRMIKKYGKISLCNDPEHQKKMLAARKISGTYTWSDGSGSLTYTGSYELDFLKYCDIILNFDVSDIMAPSPHIYSYKYEQKDHFYLPDFYIQSLNLEIEIKASDNTHHKIVAVDHVKEKLKDDVMRSQKVFNYIKIYDKNYKEFTELVNLLKEKDDVTKDVIVIAKDPVMNDEAKELLATEEAQPFQTIDKEANHDRV